MNKKWNKGEPVKLWELMRVMPLVQEALQASADLKVSVSDLLWLVGKMAEDTDGLYEAANTGEDTDEFQFLDELKELMLDGLADSDENEEEEEGCDSDINYAVSVKINGVERFPEVSFKAGITEKSDLIAFFEWLADMVDKMDN